MGSDSKTGLYCVFSLGNSLNNIAPGDELRGDFHAITGTAFAAENLTRSDKPWIDLLFWKLSLEAAVLRLTETLSPTQFLVDSQLILAKEGNVAGQLLEQIRRQQTP
jgi:hypothetical protein